METVCNAVLTNAFKLAKSVDFATVASDVDPLKLSLNLATTAAAFVASIVIVAAASVLVAYLIPA